MPRTKDLFFIVIINWNRKNLKLQSLKSVKKNIKKRDNVFVVLVDNDSSDNSVAEIKKLSFPFDFHLIINKKNIGWSGAHNVGIKYALKKGANAVLLLNNDAVITVDTIKELKKTLFSDKKIGIVSPKIYHYNFKRKIIFNAGNMLNKFTYVGNN